ncbi:MAG: branched-chain amino acid ABC transporter permease [Geodermatophilaceae bacterium]
MSDTTIVGTSASGAGAPSNPSRESAAESDNRARAVAAAPPDPQRRSRRLQWILAGVAVLLLALFPIYQGGSLLYIGLTCMAAAVGAVGLTLLTGVTGQLSLAHAFFLAIGTYAYAYLSGEPGGQAVQYGGLGLHPVLGAIGGVLLAGVAGLLFSPIASRLRGIYLGVASLSLVLIGQHVLFNWDTVTGGFNGRPATEFSLFGFGFSKDRPENLFVLDVPFGKNERLWYLFLVILVLACLFARNLLRSRPGRALQMVRDREVAASVMGVGVARYKAYAFVLSSLYAGLAGVMLALVLRPTPESFGLVLSISYLAMIVIGGLGSVVGAVVGATFVTALPAIFQQYSDLFPFLAQPGTGGLDASTLAKFLYGGAVVVVLLVEPGGLGAVGRRFIAKVSGAARMTKRTVKSATTESAVPDPQVGNVTATAPPAQATTTAATDSPTTDSAASQGDSPPQRETPDRASNQSDRDEEHR